MEVKLILKKLGHKFGPKGPKSGLKLVFCNFFKFDSIVFLENAYDGSLQHCLTSIRGKTHKKKICDQIWANTGQN